MQRLGSKNAKLRFEWEGRAFHPAVRVPADLRGLLRLDPALWGASAAPIATLSLDPVFLRRTDLDGDGRIRADEVRAAISWFLDCAAGDEAIELGSDRTSPSAFNRENPEGRRLAFSAQKACRFLGLDPDRDRLSLAQVRQLIARIREGGLEAPGRVRPEVVQEEPLRRLLEDARLAAGSGPADRAVTEEDLDALAKKSAAYLAWADRRKEAEQAAGLPGENLRDLCGLLEAIGPLLDQWFALSQALRFGALDTEAARKAFTEAFSPGEEPLQARLKRLPIAWPDPSCKLPLEGNLNPAWEETLLAFRRRAVEPLLGKKDKLSRADWEELKRRLAPAREWLAANPAPELEQIPPARLREYREQPELIEKARALIRSSHENAFELENLERLERWLATQKEICALTNCFAGFLDLYNPNRRSAVEIGSLLVDGRWLDFCVRVEDRKRHAAFCRQSRLFVVYAEILDAKGKRLFEAAAPVTRGFRGRLQPAKWGVFVDRSGAAYHARLVEIVENPISVAEAAAAPFRRVAQSVSARMDAWAAQTDKEIAQKAEALLSKPPAKEAPAPASFGWGGLMAGGGIALAAMGSAAAFIARTLAETAPLKLLAVVLGGAALVCLPFALVAATRLSQRDLACMLEGAGWGVNVKMGLTWRLARRFTRKPFPLTPALTSRGWLRLLLAAGSAAAAAAAAYQLLKAWL